MGLDAHQLQILAGDTLDLQEAVNKVGGQEQRLWHQLHDSQLTVRPRPTTSAQCCSITCQHSTMASFKSDLR